jgi:hypothetical protein
VYWIVWVLWITYFPPTEFKLCNVLVCDISPYLCCIGVWFLKPLNVIPLLVDKLDRSMWFCLLKSPIGSLLRVIWVFYPKGVSNYVVWEVWFISGFDSGKLPLFCGLTNCYGSCFVDWSLSLRKRSNYP